MSILLSLDQSSHTTGYSIFKDEQLIETSHFTVSGANLGKRLLKFQEKIQELIKNYHPDQVVFEDIQLQERIKGQRATDNVVTFKTLAEVIGVLQLTLTIMKIPYEKVLPIVWKSTFGIAGEGRKTEKKKAQEYVQKRFKINCTEDESDSICIGLHWIQNNQDEISWVE